MAEAEGVFVRRDAGPASAASAASTGSKQRPLSRAEALARPGMDLVGDPNAQKAAYNIPGYVTGKGGEVGNLQMVWGPGTFGYTPSDLAQFYDEFSVANADEATVSGFGNPGEMGGDNWYEGTLDVTYVSSLGAGAETVVANTNSSVSTEETTGFGYALLAFSESLASAGTGGEGSLPTLPNVVSMSLGSLSFDSCASLCGGLASAGTYTEQECEDYMATQRQVCMYDGGDLVDRINAEFMKASARGVTLLAATGDGGSHFSFGAFEDDGAIGSALNDMSCGLQLPTFPAESPFVLGVGGEQWEGGGSAEAPVYWYAGGAGFSRRFKMPSYQKEAVAG